MRNGEVMHNYQWHPGSDDFGVCATCGDEAVYCDACGAVLIGPHEGDKWCPSCSSLPSTTPSGNPAERSRAAFREERDA